jgi:hypothetical protein
VAGEPREGKLLPIATGGHQLHLKALFGDDLQRRRAANSPGVAETARPPNHLMAGRHECPGDGPGSGGQQPFAGNGPDRIDQPDQPPGGMPLFRLPPFGGSGFGGRRMVGRMKQHREMVANLTQKKCVPVFSGSVTFLNRPGIILVAVAQRPLVPPGRCQGPARGHF